MTNKKTNAKTVLATPNTQIDNNAEIKLTQQTSTNSKVTQNVSKPIQTDLRLPKKEIKLKLLR